MKTFFLTTLIIWVALTISIIVYARFFAKKQLNQRVMSFSNIGVFHPGLAEQIKRQLQF